MRKLAVVLSFLPGAGLVAAYLVVAFSLYGKRYAFSLPMPLLLAGAFLLALGFLARRRPSTGGAVFTFIGGFALLLSVPGLLFGGSTIYLLYVLPAALALLLGGILNLKVGRALGERSQAAVAFAFLPGAGLVVAYLAIVSQGNLYGAGAAFSRPLPLLIAGAIFLALGFVAWRRPMFGGGALVALGTGGLLFGVFMTAAMYTLQFALVCVFPVSVTAIVAGILNVKAASAIEDKKGTGPA